MPVQIQELEVVPPAPGQGAPQAGGQQQPQQQSGAPDPDLERRLERAARLRRARELRLEAD